MTVILFMLAYYIVCGLVCDSVWRESNGFVLFYIATMFGWIIATVMYEWTTREKHDDSERD